ncbi:mycocerosic acid synthase [Mycolicibacterium arabiense]|uniref:Mycocerosic acid synthase n=1 Tax=Mycolicibacterium arabiense TaxID=1286181 RepID=A0A7I7S1N9_9MYCO|nr:type I polyketide synthase [Mycolicibacterium arabiense]MCV7371630.1 type I polyketide synthase [Mycolicibacterium arabiense]BBY50340.1 mycocerosic acid synthase [Mycolicibacterium arabiense]
MKVPVKQDRPDREPLAIVGIGCRLPGDVGSPEDYWELLCNGTDATRVVPETRWTATRFYDSNPAKAGKMVTRRGGYLEEIDQFDAQFFGISPREANLLDPQQRLLLQTTWEALEDGGIPAQSLAGTEVGVFIGGFTLDYQLLQNQGTTSRFRFKTHSATGMMMTMLANRISYAFDLRGPSMSIDTACSSSLVAVHLAAQSIWNGECSLALAGGVNVIVGPNTAIAESKSGFLSADGRCKAFDESADGYARGEGGAVVVIKPLEQALHDGDRIYAQVLGSAVTQDGNTDGITVPSEDAQRSAITTALRRARVHPNEVGYVEAHGTGTPVGDPVELRALAGALASDRPATEPLIVGSVKTNIGHLEAGAGVAGLIKAALVLQHGHIPANLHFNNPTSVFAELNVDVPRSGRPFPVGERRIAGVNSFGFGGTNAHVVLAEPPTRQPQQPDDPGRQSAPTVLPISARSEDALVAVAQQLADHVRAHPDLTLADLGYNLSQRRSHLTYRRALIADGIDDALDQLDAIAAGGGHTSAGRTSATSPKLAFVCTGMGPQWWKMCRGLLDVYPVFTETVIACDRELSKYADWSLLEELRRDEADSRMGDTEIAQPANFAIQVALAAQLREFGIVPDAVVGHSAGEVAAHHLAGLLTFEQAVHVIYHRSRLQQRTSGLGRMLAVGLSAERLLRTVDPATHAEFGQRVSVAAINSPFAVTIAGDGDVLDEIARQLDEADVFNRYLPVAVPYHTHYMDTVKDDLLEAFDGLSSATATIPLYSTVTGEQLTDYSAGAAYWWQNTRATVLFEPAARRMLEDGYTHFVELGPHPVLASSIHEIAGTQAVSVLATQRRNGDDDRSLLECVGALHGNGHDLAWESLNPRRGANLVKLPSYPWQSKRFWNEPPEAAQDLHYEPVHRLLGQSVSAVHPTWEGELSVATIGFLADHQVQGTVVIPGAVFAEMAAAAAYETYGTACSVDDLVLHRALIIDDACDPLVRTTLDEDKGTLEFAAFTATGDGDFKWTLTATAELNTLPPSPPSRPYPSEMSGTSMTGDEFYARTREIGFGYGDAFRAVTSIVAGAEWAVAEIDVPAEIVDELDAYHFHPALVDSAFQTLFGTRFVGADGEGSAGGTYLPTRIRHSAVYGPPEKSMTVQVRVVSSTAEEIESDITVANGLGETLAVFDGFTVQSLQASSAMSTERIDKGLYEMQWIPGSGASDVDETSDGTADLAWLVLADDTGLGALVAADLRSRGHRVSEVAHRAVDELTESQDGYVVDPARPEQFRALLDAHLAKEGDLAGIVDCWALDVPASPVGVNDETAQRVGVFAILHLVTALAELDTVTPRLHLVTANAQPALGTETLAVDQSAIWGLGRVVGHQEFAANWGGLIDVDEADDRELTASRICRHLLDADSEDQVAIRGETSLVPRLRPCANLTRPFPTKLSADATYVVTGGSGALGRTVAGYLAERGARHIALLSRRELPPRAQWPDLEPEHPHFRTVETIRSIERLGAEVVCASVDVTDAAGVETWLADHVRSGGRPVRGVVHTAGSVDDRLLVNTTESDFTAVMAPKVTGTRVLHHAFECHDLQFFVMFGSAGSVVASPGQGNYAAANAFLDAFAYYRRAQGLPALTIGWGPWSVGMVEELKLERIYAQRGIELITPRAGARILDRLINQKTPTVTAITADWGRARQMGLAGQLPPMFSELEVLEPSLADGEAGSSILDVLAETPEEGRLDVVTEQVRRSVAAIFDCAVAEVEVDETLDDVGLDSLMAMEFRMRINAMFAIDIPVLEILKGVSVNSLAARVLGELELPRAGELSAPPADDPDSAADVEQLVAGLSDDELRELLAELEADGS